MKRLIVLAASVLALSCATVTPPPAQPVHVVVVGTTDVHGWFNGHPSAKVPYGGSALLASYVDALRAENSGRVVLVDSGDMFQGTLESNLFEGEPVIRAYNLLGYAAAAIGNHEFDFGPVGTNSVPRASGDDPVGALKRNAQTAKFPFISANFIEKATGRTPAWARRYVVVDAGGARIGLIGLSSPDTPNTTTPANVTEFLFTDPVKATVDAARELRTQNVDAIVVVGHMGGRCTNVDDVNAVVSCERDQEAMHFLESLPPGTIDGYFGGHTHAQMRTLVNGVPALQAEAFSTKFATLDLWIDPRAHRVTKEEMRPHTMICSVVFSGTESCDPRDAAPGTPVVPRVFEGRTISADSKVAAAVAPYLERVAAKRNEKLGITTAAPFIRAYRSESTLGDLLADALRDATNADVAFMNSGGIRANLPAGEIVYSNIFEVSPFDNYPAVVQMTGAQIRELLRLTTRSDHGVLQVSGLRYVFDEAPAGGSTESDRLVSVTLANGDPLEAGKLYRVAMPDFIAVGGDATARVMKTIPAQNITVSQEKPIREVIIEALQKRQEVLVPKADGRITVLNQQRDSAR